MDDDIYTADGHPHIPPSSYDRRGSQSNGSDGSLNVRGLRTHLSKTLPDEPPVPPVQNQTYTDAENVSQTSAIGADSNGNGGSTLLPKNQMPSDILISSVPNRVSSISQNYPNDLGDDNPARTAGQKGSNLGSTNGQSLASDRDSINSSDFDSQARDAGAYHFNERTESGEGEWLVRTSSRIDEITTSPRDGNLGGSGSAQRLVEGDPVFETVQRASFSTESVNAGESSGQTIAPRYFSRRAVRLSQDIREVVLPRWQPDGEVTYCPICHNQFSFFVRKHHCRRCGRVVCNACSPHRITIPYQFIVQPPAAVGTSSPTTVTQRGSHRNSLMEDLSSNFADRNGGMKVRLCNPCVPDPNPLPPQQFPDEVGPPTLYLTRDNRPRSYIDESTGGNLGRMRGMSAASALRASDPANTASSNRSSLLPIAPPFNYSRPMPHNAPLRGQDAAASSRFRSPYSTSPGQSSQNRGHGNRLQHQSLSFTPGTSAPNLQPHYRSLLDVGSNQHTRAPSSTTRPLPPIPRLEEDDTCPVCHQALPSRDFADFEDRRAAHITQCIDEQLVIHSGQSSRPAAYTSQSQPVPSSAAPERPSQQQTQPAMPPTGLRLAISPLLSTPESRAAAREAAHASVVLGPSAANASNGPARAPGRRTGMFVYSASEKDCIDDAECTICLEEFVVGAQMARLECFCRFHKTCIGEWFVDHPGRCPVHSHDGFGF